MPFPTSPSAIPKQKPGGGTIGEAVSRRPFKMNAQARISFSIEEDFGRTSILSYCEIRSTVSIHVRGGGRSLLSWDADATLLSRHWPEPTSPVPQQEKTAASGFSGVIQMRWEEILRDEQILVAIPIEVGHGDSKSGRELRFRRKPGYFKSGAGVAENDAGQ